MPTTFDCTSCRTYGWTTKPHQLPSSAAGQTASSPLLPDEDLGDISEGDEAAGASFPSSNRQQSGQGDGSRGAQTATSGAGIQSRASRNEAASLMADEFRRGVGLHDVEDDESLGVEENAAPMRVDLQAEDSFGN